MSENRLIKTDRMRYTKNTVSSRLALLAIVFNVLYFVNVYQSDVGEYYYTILIGASVICNLIFMLTAFLSSEGVKNYKKGYSFMLFALSALQIGRIFILPRQMHETVWKTVKQTIDGVKTNVDLMVMEDGQFIYLIIMLVLSALCCFVSAVINLIKSHRLEAHIAALNKEAA